MHFANLQKNGKLANPNQQKPRVKYVHLINTIHHMGKIYVVSIFSDICYFLQRYMKNKIGILENNIYFPILVEPHTALETDKK